MRYYEIWVNHEKIVVKADEMRLEGDFMKQIDEENLVLFLENSLVVAIVKGWDAIFDVTEKQGKK